MDARNTPRQPSAYGGGAPCASTNEQTTQEKKKRCSFPERATWRTIQMKDQQVKAIDTHDVIGEHSQKETRRGAMMMKSLSTMNMKLIGYWTATGIVAFELVVGGVTDVVHGREVLVVGDP